MTEIDVSCSWVEYKTEESIQPLADFFINNIHKNYISFSEVIDGFADHNMRWSDNLRLLIIKKMLKKNHKIAVTKDRLTHEIIALSIVEMNTDSWRAHAWIHDFIVVSKCRGQNVGGKLINWLEQEFRNNKIELIILESGIHNDGAHHFFENHEFKHCSIVMTKFI
jgi:GNAT superfamily N-acetyltransferase